MRPRIKQNWKLLAMMAAAGVAIIATALIQLTKKDTSPTAAEVITSSTDTPDETKPDDKYKWHGSARDPKYIRLPSIGAEGYLQNVGVDQRQEIAVPNNIHMAGWFVDSVSPGETGLSIIDGHLNGRGQNGIFTDLENIQKGAIYSLEFGDGSIREFRVKDVVVEQTDKAAGVLFSQDPSIKNQLNLITCGGNFDTNTRLYDKRVIVVSELVSD